MFFNKPQCRPCITKHEYCVTEHEYCVTQHRCCCSSDCHPCTPQCAPSTSVVKIVSDCNLCPAPHTLTLRSRDETFYFDICMNFGCDTPQPICLIDQLDPRLQLCMRPDGCPDVELYMVDDCGCFKQGEGAVLDWDGACRKLTMKISPCLDVACKKLVLRLHVRVRTEHSTMASEVINRCVLCLGNTQVQSNAVMVRIPASRPPCTHPPHWWDGCKF